PWPVHRVPVLLRTTQRVLVVRGPATRRRHDATRLTASCSMCGTGRGGGALTPRPAPTTGRIRPMSDNERAAMSVVITRALKDRLDQIAEHTGAPTVRIIESLLRDDLSMPAMYPGLARTARQLAKRG